MGHRILAIIVVVLACGASARGELVTVVYEGVINQIDAAVASGPFSVGQSVSGSYTYENDPALNLDRNGGPSLGQYDIASSSDVAIGGIAYATSPGLGLAIFNDVDGWDASWNIAAPPIGSYTASGFSISLRDLDSTVFPNDSLPPGPPALSEFETSTLLLLYFNGSSIARIDATVNVHEVPTDPVTLRFSGPLIDVEDLGGATYSGLDVDDPMQGDLTIGGSSAGSTLEPPAKYLFPGAGFFGTLLGDGIETSTEGSARPLEVNFSDDVVDPEAIDLVNALLGTNLPPNTPFDLAEIETDITNGTRRTEFGVSFLSLDLDLITGPGYRPFPTLDEVDVAVYFVVEELNDVEIYNALGLIESFGPVFSPGEALDLVVTGYDVGTSMVDIAFTAGCSATDHSIVYGPLSAVGSYGYAGQVCGIGMSGTATFDPGSENAFYLVVANDGILEGSYGRTGAGTERPEDLQDTVCLLTQDLTNTCTP